MGLKIDLICILNYELFFSHHTRKWQDTFCFPVFISRSKQVAVKSQAKLSGFGTLTLTYMEQNRKFAISLWLFHGHYLDSGRFSSVQPLHCYTVQIYIDNCDDHTSVRLQMLFSDIGIVFSITVIFFCKFYIQ